MDEFKDSLIKGVPEDVKVGEHKFAYAMLLSFVKTNPITDKRHLNKMLKQELDRCSNWLDRNKTFSATSKEQREYARKVEYVLSMRKLVRKYL
ncbi:MAG: hypothetical protein ABIB71_03550 [Candidatus Woesearchaeota archaeon]